MGKPFFLYEAYFILFKGKEGEMNLHTLRSSEQRFINANSQNFQRSFITSKPEVYMRVDHLAPKVPLPNNLSLH